MGILGNDPGQLNYSQAIDTDSLGNVYVVTPIMIEFRNFLVMENL